MAQTHYEHRGTLQEPVTGQGRRATRPVHIVTLVDRSRYPKAHGSKREAERRVRQMDERARKAGQGVYAHQVRRAETDDSLPGAGAPARDPAAASAVVKAMHLRRLLGALPPSPPADPPEVIEAIRAFNEQTRSA
jgi:hypothetical protein